MASLIGRAVEVVAPIFLMCSPVTSYADQIVAMHRTRNSAGFSLDIPLIMLTASILKIFYWPGARYDASLLIQSGTMIAVQAVLLKVALDNRRPDAASSAHQPFAGLGGRGPAAGMQRPWGFWRWRSQHLYWQFLLLFTLALLSLQIVVAPNPGRGTTYTALLGGLGLTIEAGLPLPQLHSNWQARSCRGFRLSVLANWLVGDALKLGFFFMSDAGKVPWAFKLCASFQALCDVGLGLQYYIYGEGGDPVESEKEKDMRLL